MRRTPLVLLIAGSLGVAALADQSPKKFTSWPIRDAPSELRLVISRADLVIVTMQDAVLRELTEALDRGGPVAALGSCHLDATGVSYRLGHEGIAAGRTSDRLRSPTNVPPAWAADLVKTNAGARARDVEGFAADLGTKVGVLRPIAERPICANCHGPVDRISPKVRQLLMERYPVDRAVGFSEGEIRGWFWVEMPK
jgi:uncharacterized protein DUF3365